MQAAPMASRAHRRLLPSTPFRSSSACCFPGTAPFATVAAPEFIWGMSASVD
jgi:hypothetical protein